MTPAAGAGRRATENPGHRIRGVTFSEAASTSTPALLPARFGTYPNGARFPRGRLRTRPSAT